MNTPLLPTLLTLAAASAFAQTAPMAKTSSGFQHSVQASYFTASSKQADVDNPSGYVVSGRAYVWNNVFLTLDYFDATADGVVLGAPTGLGFTRFGYGLGASLKVGPGQLDLSYTLGKLDYEIDVLGSLDADQERATVAYSQVVGYGLTASLAVTQFFNEEIFGDDATGVTVGLSYDFSNGLSAGVTFSPDDTVVGLDGGLDNTWTVGAKYSF